MLAYYLLADGQEEGQTDAQQIALLKGLKQGAGRG